MTPFHIICDVLSRSSKFTVLMRKLVCFFEVQILQYVCFCIHAEITISVRSTLRSQTHAHTKEFQNLFKMASYPLDSQGIGDSTVTNASVSGYHR